MNMHEYMDLYLHIYVLIYLNVRSNDVAYMTLYESSIANGIRKALMAHQKISELDAKLRLLTATKVPACLTACLSSCLLSFLFLFFLLIMNYSVVFFYSLILGNKY